MPTLSRRRFARLGLAAGALALDPGRVPFAAAKRAPLGEFGYAQVRIDSPPHRAQIENTQSVLMSLDEDSLLKPFRQMSGQPAPGADLAGWYRFDPNFDFRRDDAGFAPGATFGQWISALARYHAMSGDATVRAKVQRLNRLYGATIEPGYYAENRFPAYCYDKLVLGLIDSRAYTGDEAAPRLLERTTATAVPHLPGHAVDRELEWRAHHDQSYRWDESYTLPENLFIAYTRGAGRRYRELAVHYLDDATWFDPLARDENVLEGKHAYSYVNSLSSAMQAWLTLGSGKHLTAATHAFRMLTEQSFATGGWGPDEKLVAPGSDTLAASLDATHNSFETPCGAYAHFKLTRYLLRVTRDARYGDSMERVMYNTVLGARPLHTDGSAFYYADYNVHGHKVYSNHGFPCCSGTLPQVATDYGINTWLRAPDGVYVNLYIPSRLSWRQGGVPCTLTQRGNYPFADDLSLECEAARPVEFTVYLRVPAWARGARIEVNGSRITGPAEPGTFAAVTRTWRTGDRIELSLPRPLRLETLDARHPDTVALLAGPLVLFPIEADPATVAPRRSELLGARQMQARRWEARIGDQSLTLLPYTEIDEQPYTTYLRVSA